MTDLRAALSVIVIVLLVGAEPRSGDSLPNRPNSVKFAVIGDNGTGERPQFELAAEMKAVRGRFPFAVVLMVGDNFYGRQRPEDLRQKFDRPYEALLAEGVRFQATIGNHDDPKTIEYPPLNMQGRRYYTFVEGNVRFFALDSNALDQRQLDWLSAALASATEPWKVAFFHHPIYSDGDRHGSSIETRAALEPMLTRHGVSVVFSGHDHIYERILPQRGITYFVCGSSGQLRRGGLKRSPATAAGFDQDLVFLVVEIDGDRMFFEAISRTGVVVDSGSIERRSMTGS